MIISKIAMVRWNGFTRKWYEDRGYIYTKQGEFFECKIEDIQHNSTVKIKCECGYCGKEYETEYRKYLKSLEKVKKACCSDRKCMVEKSREVSIVKYGVDNHMKTKESKEIFNKKNRTPFEDIREMMKKKGLKIISEEKEYRNEHSDLKYICQYHLDKGIQESSVMEMNRNKHCCVHGGQEATVNSIRIDGNVVYNDFVKKGLIPQFNPEDYKCNSDLLPYICSKHKNVGIQYKKYAYLNSSKGCPECKKEILRMIFQQDETTVFDYFEKRGMIVEPNQRYVNKDTHIYFRCNKHNDELQKTTFSNLKRTEEICEYCREENRVDSIYTRVRSCLSGWRDASKEILGNNCIFTKSSKNIEIHHQIQFIEILKETLQGENFEIKDDYNGSEFVKIKKRIKEMHNKTYVGVPMCGEIHMLYHSVYGKKKSNRVNFIEFIRRYSNGEFDSRIDEKLKSTNNPINAEEMIKKTGIKLNEIDKFEEAEAI